MDISELLIEAFRDLGKGHFKIYDTVEEFLKDLYDDYDDIKINQTGYIPTF